jgi:hypothetical protein
MALTVSPQLTFPIMVYGFYCSFKVNGWHITHLPTIFKNTKIFLLIKPETFPINSRELEAVEGSTANAGYNDVYNILCMHHPILHSVYSMDNEIP